MNFKFLLTIHVPSGRDTIQSKLSLASELASEFFIIPQGPTIIIDAGDGHEPTQLASSYPSAALSHIQDLTTGSLRRDLLRLLVPEVEHVPLGFFTQADETHEGSYPLSARCHCDLYPRRVKRAYAKNFPWREEALLNFVSSLLRESLMSQCIILAKKTARAKKSHFVCDDYH